MAKLFITVEDEKGTHIQKIADHELEIKVFYGNKEDSRRCLHLVIKADDKDAFQLPKVFCDSKSLVQPMTIQ